MNAKYKYSTSYRKEIRQVPTYIILVKFEYSHTVTFSKDNGLDISIRMMALASSITEGGLISREIIG